MSVLGRLVAIRYVDGTVLKGWTTDFKPACTSFHVRDEDGSVTELRTDNLKAVFFIRSLGGDPDHEERKDYSLKTTPEKKIWVEFHDGEALAGWSTAFASGKAGFYLTPTDPGSNMERAYVFRSAVRSVIQGDDAVRAAQEHQAKGTGGQPSGASRLFELD